MYYLKRLHFFQEIFILFLFLILINNYYENTRPVILADGKGYYEYLPAVFIYKDLNFAYTDTLISRFYDHKATSSGYLHLIKGNKINKYFVGTAVSLMPFFLTAHLIATQDSNIEADGYSLIYQDFVFYAALFYLFIGLLFLRKLLEIYRVPTGYIFVLQIVTLFSSSLMYYASNLPSFSHVYSFAFVNLFLYFISKYNIKPHKNELYWAAFALGMIILIRPVNGLIILFVPYIFDSWSTFILTLKSIFTRNKLALIISTAIILLLISIQPVIWYLQTGNFYVNSYQEERLILTQPNIIKFLFSYQKGFFVYAPAFFILILLGVITSASKKNYWKLFSFLVPYLIVVYILSSWWVWFYGASYGSRVMIDYYGVIILFGSSFYSIKTKFIKQATFLLFGFFIYLAIVQTFQYKNFIMHWARMNKERYWQIFLKTEPQYKGLYWMNTYYLKADQIVLDKTISDQYILNPEINTTSLIDSTSLKNIDGEASKHLLQLEYKVNFKQGLDQFMVIADDTAGNNLYYTKKYLFNGVGKEDFEGTGLISLEIKSNKLKDSLLKIYLIKNEKDATIESVRMRIAKL
ncbi:MAG: hypothetical protein H0S84_11075 [Bacteroidales bacterium]|jgi:hypothetical protein|nr:hypothetical protein [Bacteroidales bacterium]MDN5349891.1 hypothetical protein [Bacteroidales bacterium]